MEGSVNLVTSYDMSSAGHIKSEEFIPRRVKNVLYMAQMRARGINFSPVFIVPTQYVSMEGREAAVGWDCMAFGTRNHQ